MRGAAPRLKTAAAAPLTWLRNAARTAITGWRWRPRWIVTRTLITAAVVVAAGAANLWLGQPWPGVAAVQCAAMGWWVASLPVEVAWPLMHRHPHKEKEEQCHQETAPASAGDDAATPATGAGGGPAPAGNSPGSPSSTATGSVPGPRTPHASETREDAPHD